MNTIDWIEKNELFSNVQYTYIGTNNKQDSKILIDNVMENIYR